MISAENRTVSEFDKIVYAGSQNRWLNNRSVIKTISTIYVLTALMFSQYVCADETGASPASNARTFAVDEVKLGMTIDDFKKLYPTAEPFVDLSDSDNNVQGFRINSTKNTDGIDAAFWEGKLMDFYVWYFPARTKEMGGFNTILKRLIDKFGKGDADSKGYDNEDSLLEIHWRIPDADFYCQFEVKPRRSVMNVTDTKAYHRLTESKRKKADVGF